MKKLFEGSQKLTQTIKMVMEDSINDSGAEIFSNDADYDHQDRPCTDLKSREAATAAAGPFQPKRLKRRTPGQTSRQSHTNQ